MMRKKKVLIAAVVLMIAVVTAAGWVWHSGRNAKAAETDVVLVRAQRVGSADGIQRYTYAGEVRGRYESQLAFQVGGKIILRNVELGGSVKAGDVIMQIDAKDIRQSVNIVSAQVASAESQRKLAEVNLERYRRLYEQGAVSRAQYDQYISAYEVAVAMARQASAQYAQGANQLDYSSLRADKPGVVAAITAETGQVVGAGQAVVTIVQDGEREIEINVPENRIGTLRQASQVMVSFWALPQIKVAGKVREISPMADAIARTYKVRISLPASPSEVTLGMTASVEIFGAEVSAGTTSEILLSAVYQTEDKPAVWVVKDNSVHLRPVQVGKLGKSTIQVTGGLQPGDIIVTAGVHKLREGQKVKPADGVMQ